MDIGNEIHIFRSGSVRALHKLVECGQNEPVFMGFEKLGVNPICLFLYPRIFSNHTPGLISPDCKQYVLISSRCQISFKLPTLE